MKNPFSNTFPTITEALQAVEDWYAGQIVSTPLSYIPAPSYLAPRKGWLAGATQNETVVVYARAELPDGKIAWSPITAAEQETIVTFAWNTPKAAR